MVANSSQLQVAQASGAGCSLEANRGRGNCCSALRSLGADPRGYNELSLSPRGSTEQVLYIMTERDHSGAYQYSEFLCQRILCWYDRGYSVTVKRVGTVDQAMAAVRSVGRQPIKQAIVAGHGDKSCILKLKDDGKEALISEDRKTGDIFRELSTRMVRNNAKLFVWSCGCGGAVCPISIGDWVKSCVCGGGSSRRNLVDYAASKMPGVDVMGCTKKFSDQQMTNHLVKGDCPAEDNMDIMDYEFDHISATYRARTCPV